MPVVCLMNDEQIRSGWFHRSGGEVAGHVRGCRADVVRRLAESGNREARVKLAADLPGQRVAVLQRNVGAPQPVELRSRAECRAWTASRLGPVRLGT